MSDLKGQGSMVNDAIRSCEDFIKEQRQSISKLILLGVGLTLVIVFATVFIVTSTTYDPTTMIVSSFGAFIVVFSILIALYRFHQVEISKMEHYKLGFQRVRLVIMTYGTECDKEVINALTQEAFTPPLSKKTRIESPVPGHPGSDIAALMISKVFEGLEVRVKPAEKRVSDNTIG